MAQGDSNQYHIVEKGTPYSLDYRVYFSES